MIPVEIRGIRIGEGIPKICIPIVGETEQEIETEAYAVREAAPELAEWRADCFEQVLEEAAVRRVLKKLRSILGDMPLLFTFRSHREGGSREISIREYADLGLLAASAEEVDLIDVEAFTSEELVREMIDAAHRCGKKVIASYHDFHKTPEKEEMVDRLVKMQETGADICKLAVMPGSSRDVLELLAATEEMVRCHADCPVVTMSMAKTGAVSRISGELTGSAVTFGTAGRASAPGQMEAGQLREILRLLHGAEDV